MGSIGHRYESGAQAANKGHYNNLVMLTRVDGKVHDSEFELLARMAQRLSLTDEQVKEIIRNPEEYPMIPPFSKEERFERFIQFIEMTFVDGEIDPKEEALISKYGVKLGIDPEEVSKYSALIIDKVKESIDSSEILKLVM